MTQMMRRIALPPLIALIALAPIACDDDIIVHLDLELELEPAAIDFGAVYAGERAVRTFIVRNRGEAPFSVTALHLDRAELRFDPPAPSILELAAGAERALPIAFSSDVLGPVIGALSLRIEGEDVDRRVLLTAEVIAKPAAMIHVCVESSDIPLARTCDAGAGIDFGAVPPGAERVAFVTLESEHDVPLFLGFAGLTSGSDPAFETAPSALRGLPLEKGKPRRIGVRYTATTESTGTGSVQISSNDPSRPSILIPLIARGGAPSTLCVSPEVVDFGRIHLGRSPEAEIRVENCGERPLSIRSTELIDAPSTFAMLTALDGVSIGRGASRNIRVRYTPLDLIAETGRLRIASDAGDVWVELRGEGRNTHPVLDCGLLHLESNYCLTQSPGGMAIVGLDSGIVCTLSEHTPELSSARAPSIAWIDHHLPSGNLGKFYSCSWRGGIQEYSFETRQTTTGPGERCEGLTRFRDGFLVAPALNHLDPQTFHRFKTIEDARDGVWEEYRLVGGHDATLIGGGVERLNSQNGKLYVAWAAGPSAHVFEDHFYQETVTVDSDVVWTRGMAITEDDLVVISRSEAWKLQLFERSTGALIAELPTSSRLEALSCFTNPR